MLELTPRDIQAYYNHKLDAGLSANTVKKHHANIRKALQTAVQQNLIPYNIADRTQLPRIKKYVPRIYNESQLAALLEIAKDTPLESAVMICCHHALRRGEICGIRWIDVDFEQRVIHLRNTRTTAGAEIEQDTTKNGSEEDVLPMSDELFTYMKNLRKKQALNKMFFGPGYTDSGYVCAWDDGKPLKVSYVSQAFRNLLKKNGLPQIRLHDIRHSVATSLLNNGIDLKIIQEYLRHSNITTTANFYLHPDMKQKQRAADKIGNLLKAN